MNFTYFDKVNNPTGIPVELSWEQFKEQMKNTTRTPETVVEFKTLSKKEQTDTKDVGAYVPATCTDGKCTKENVDDDLQMIFLDADDAKDTDLIDRVAFGAMDYTCCIYSTHKHTPEAPRLRLCIPVNRPMTKTEYEVVSRTLANDLGMDQFDPTTFQPGRKMFLPSTSKDGVFVYEECEAGLLDVDKVLSKYEHPEQRSLWPMHPNENKIQTTNGHTLMDPRKKDGVVGLFCRAYPITEALKEFLYAKYEPTDSPDRWTLKDAESYGGLVVYDDLYAYSNHATDPIQGKSLNAFDLVRLCRFGEGEGPNAKRQSFNKMKKLVENDEKCQKLLKEEERQKAKDKGIIDDEDDGEWVATLQRDKDGELLSTLNNLVIILQNDKNLKNGIGAVNEFSHRTQKLAKLPWWNYEKSSNCYEKSDESSLKVYLERTYGIRTFGNVSDAVTYVQNINKFHPVRDYLHSLQWDGVKRLDTLFIDYLGAPDTPYTRETARIFMTAAVARIFRPGIKFDEMLVLVGKQGCGKSTFIRKLAVKSEWFSDSLNFGEIGKKDAFEKLQGKWILEFGELAGLRKKEMESVKGFVSGLVDSYRPAYGLGIQDYARQCVFAGTTNNAEFLRDTTGNRRFWIIDIDTEKMTKSIFDDLDNEIDQIYAEAYENFMHDGTLLLSEKAKETAAQMQMQHTFIDAVGDEIENFLETPVLNGWDNLGISEADKLYFGELRDGGTVQRTKVTLREIWEYGLGKDGKPKPYEQQDMVKHLNRLGWVKVPTQVRTWPHNSRSRQCYIKK